MIAIVHLFAMTAFPTFRHLNPFVYTQTRMGALKSETFRAVLCDIVRLNMDELEAKAFEGVHVRIVPNSR